MSKKSNKEREKILQKEKNVLKETLDIIVRENFELKDTLLDIQNNVTENKFQLQEKINSISNKESAVEMLNNQIEILKQRFNDLQVKKNMQSFIGVNNSEENLNSKDETTNPTTVRILKDKNLEYLKDKKEQEKKLNLIKDNIGKQKAFLQKQEDLQNEIYNLKREVKILKEKIDNNRNKYLYYQYNYNLQNYFKKEDLNNLQKVLSKNTNNKLLYFVSKDGKVYKMKRRDDLNSKNFIDEINLDFRKEGKGNEIKNIRERHDISEKNKKLKYPFNNNYYNDSDSSIGDEYLTQQVESKNDLGFISRNKPKATGLYSYVNDLLRGSFVL